MIRYEKFQVQYFLRNSSYYAFTVRAGMWRWQGIRHAHHYSFHRGHTAYVTERRRQHHFFFQRSSGMERVRRGNDSNPFRLMAESASDKRCCRGCDNNHHRRTERHRRDKNRRSNHQKRQPNGNGYRHAGLFQLHHAWAKGDCGRFGRTDRHAWHHEHHGIRSTDTRQRGLDNGRRKHTYRHHPQSYAYHCGQQQLWPEADGSCIPWKDGRYTGRHGEGVSGL